MKFPIKVFFNKFEQMGSFLSTFSKEILHCKFHCLCSEKNKERFSVIPGVTLAPPLAECKCEIISPTGTVVNSDS